MTASAAADVARLRALRSQILDAVDQDPEVRVWFVAKLDAFESIIRKVEDGYIATTLRAADADPEYDLHGRNLAPVADEIERLRA